MERDAMVFFLPEQFAAFQKWIDSIGAELWQMPTGDPALPEYAIRPKGFGERGR